MTLVACPALSYKGQRTPGTIEPGLPGPKSFDVMTESIDQAKSNQVKADQTRTDLAPTDLAKARLATSFGYQDVRSEDKPKMIEDLFGRVATRYDLMNDLMSGGVHRLWKAAMIDRLAPQPGMRLVDVAGGTGDIAFRVLDRINARRSRR
ncbi:MAG: class I SAM-dependent methyltransferase, partial [Geminicoccaceae bacterium]